MENLNKQQIILLTLLVSFVTSIATGIVTVALMNQAPVGVTQTINRVVERTIEKVVPGTPTTEKQTIIKETIVVNADDQVVDAIQKNSKSIVRIYSRDGNSYSDTGSVRFVGIGVVVSDDDIIVTDNNNLVFNGGKYFIKTEDNSNRDLTLLRAVSNEEIAVFKVIYDEKKPTNLSKISLVSDGDIKLGQSVVYIGGESKNIIDTGRISGINTLEIEDKSTISSSTKSLVVTSIETTVPSRSFISGGLLLNLSGELIGIKTTYPTLASTDLFAPFNYIKKELLEVVSVQKNINN